MYSHTNSRGLQYHLNTTEVALNGGRTQTIYYFSKDKRALTSCDLPEGYVVFENKRTGLPMLRRG